MRSRRDKNGQELINVDVGEDSMRVSELLSPYLCVCLKCSLINSFFNELYKY